MPFLYLTQIKASPISGRGLFALQDIPAGAVYWVMQDPTGGKPVKNHNPKPNIAYTKSQLQAITDVDELKQILNYGFFYEQKNVFIALHDGAQFTNYSDNWCSEICYDEEGVLEKACSKALKDIKAGEEITEDYSGYLTNKSDWAYKLMQQYKPERWELEEIILKRKNIGK